MSNILSDLSNLKELELQELSEEESQLVVGGNYIWKYCWRCCW